MVKPKSKSSPARTRKPATPVPHQLCELLWTIGPAFTRWAESHMHQKGLTPQRVRLMCLLSENGPMMMSSLADDLGVSATNVTALVDALEKDAMVLRRAHPTDRRVIMMELTAKGERELEENCEEFKDKTSEIFLDFKKTEQSQLLQLLTHVRKALVDRGILEASDVCGATSSKARKS